MNNPRPTPARAFYGFVLYLLSYVVFGAYLLWAYVPAEWLRMAGIVYFPQQYWAVAVPVYFCVAFLFVLIFYATYTLILTEPLTSVNTIYDSHSRRPRGDTLGVSLQRTPRDSIPSIGDIPVQEVNQWLYKDVGEPQ